MKDKKLKTYREKAAECKAEKERRRKHAQPRASQAHRRIQTTAVRKAGTTAGISRNRVPQSTELNRCADVEGVMKYQVTVEIEPANSKYCGLCPACGLVGAEDLCTVFRERLRFYEADSGCLEFGYLRCQKCLEWEHYYE